MEAIDQAKQLISEYHESEERVKQIKDVTRKGFSRKNIVAVSFFQNCNTPIFLIHIFKLTKIIQA